MQTKNRLAFIVLLALSRPFLAAQEPSAKPRPGFRVAVNMVLVNVSVTTRDGKRRADLGPRDFDVFEDGVKQNLRFFRSTEAPFHVALLIDSSGSTGAKLDLIRKAADRFLKSLAPEDRVSLVDVAGRFEVIQGFTSDRRLLSRKLRRIGTTKENGTLLRDAILHVLSTLFRGVEGRKAVVFLTDAQDAGSRTGIEKLKQAVYVSDAVLYGLLVDTEADVLKALQHAETRFSRIALVLEARSSAGAEEVKRAATYLIDLLPASIEVCLVGHRSARRAALLVPYTQDRDQIREAINKAEVQPRATEMVSSWMVAGSTILLTDSGLDLPNRIQADILQSSAVIVLRNRPASEWQNQLQDLASKIEDPSALREAMKEEPVHYRDARQSIIGLCDHSGGRTFDLAGISDLDEFYQRVAEELRRTYSLGYYSEAAPAQYHRLEVRLPSVSQANVRARRGFVLP